MAPWHNAAQCLQTTSLRCILFMFTNGFVHVFVNRTSAVLSLLWELADVYRGCVIPRL